MKVRSKRYGADQRIRFKVGFTTLTIVSRPEHVLALQTDSKDFSMKYASEEADHCIHEVDDCDTTVEVREDREEEPENSVLSHIGRKCPVILSFKAPFQRFQDMFWNTIKAFHIGSDWVDTPDSYRVCPTTAFWANIEAMKASHSTYRSVATLLERVAMTRTPGQETVTGI
ncbi:hypothetical protein GGS21DRAFT_112982 [Xylaria nigripes]|nr:hypothetical protein GGS21DRAFT_112982 [Xylaria nigripes]